MNTIKVPRNLHYLTAKLPEPNYEPIQTESISSSRKYRRDSLNISKSSVERNSSRSKPIWKPRSLLPNLISSNKGRDLSSRNRLDSGLSRPLSKKSLEEVFLFLEAIKKI